MCTLTGAPDDVRVWSGTPAHFLTGLRAVHDDVVIIGPIAPTAHRALNTFAGLSGRLGRKVNWEVEPAALRFFTKRFDREVARSEPDVVIVMGWYPLRSGCGVPVVYWGDATIGQRLNHSPHWSGLSRRTAAHAETVEGAALRDLAGVMMASRWALDDTIDRYGVAAARMAPFGANVTDPGDYARSAPGRRSVRLLSIGVKWHRKGMDIAVGTADHLHTAGVDVHLDVVGVDPPDDSWQREYVTYHGFIEKSPDGLAELDALYRAADLFVLPTRNDPFAIVLTEAAAHGLPVVASDVGGLRDRVEDGVTGVLLPAGSGAADYARAIMELATDGERYRRYSAASRELFTTRFTWERCAEGVLENLRALLGRELADVDRTGP